MQYRRPTNFDDVVRILNEATKYDPQDERREIVLCLRRLEEMGWYKKGLYHLYNENMLVKFLVNTFVPTVVELVADPDTLKKLSSVLTDAKREKYGEGFNGVFDTLATESERAKQRTDVSPRFAEMRDSMHKMATDEQCRAGLKVIYLYVKTSRSILNMFVDRLNTALRKHKDILSSSDIPMEALMLG